VAKRMQGLADDDIDVLWVWLKNIAARGLPKDKEKEIEEIFQKERKVDNMVYAIEKVMQQERVEEKIEIAKEMLVRKMDINTVSQITKLSLATIQELAKELGH